MKSGDNDPSSHAKDRSPRSSSSGHHPLESLSVTELELRFAENPGSSVFERLCAAYLDKGRFMEAMVVCKKAARARPEDSAPKLWLARVHKGQGRLPRALEVLQQLDEDQAEVSVELGTVHAAMGESEAAIRHLKRAVDLDETMSQATEALEKLGVRYPEPPPPPTSLPAEVRISSFSAPEAPEPEQAETPILPPSDGSGVYRRAPERLEGEEELERMALEAAEAEAAPKKGRPVRTLVLAGTLVVLTGVVMAVQYQTKVRTEAIRTLSSTAVRSFDRDLYASYKEAADALEEILQRHDSSEPKTLARLSHTYAILVHEHLQSDKVARLEEVLRQAQEKVPDNPHVVSAAGLQMLYRGDDHLESATRAVAFLTPKASADQRTVPSLADLTLGIAELRRGDVDSAHRRLSEVADFMRSNVRARMWAARAAASAGRPATAWRYLAQVRQVERRHPGAIAAAALVSLAFGQGDKAKAAVDEFQSLEAEGSRDISPKDRALAVFARSELHRSQGELGAADLEYKQARDLDRNNAELPFQRGRSELTQGRLDGAIDFLREAVEMSPTRWTFRIELAEALMRAKRFKEAKEHLDVALEAAPNRLRVALTKARYLRRTGAKETEQFLKEGLPDQFPSAKVEVALELGRFYRSQGKLQEASKELSKAVAGYENKPTSLQGEVLVSYGLVAQDRGQRSEAARAYREAALLGHLDGLALLAGLLKTGNAAERAEARTAAQKYLSSGENLRRTEFVRAILNELK